jgi:hypothetical protein
MSAAYAACPLPPILVGTLSARGFRVSWRTFRRVLGGVPTNPHLTGTIVRLTHSEAVNRLQGIEGELEQLADKQHPGWSPIVSY